MMRRAVRRAVRPLMKTFEADIREIINVDVCPNRGPMPSPTMKPGLTDLQILIKKYGMPHTPLYII